MGLTHFPHGISSFGVPVLGSGPVFTTGTVYFVDSGSATAADQPSHGSKERPFATMDYANGRCAANNGDVVIVMPGHTETVAAAAGLDLDTAGVTWIGIGTGSDRPTITFTATAADMDVDAANITMRNFLFTGGIDAITAAIDVNAADFSLLDCEWRDVTGQVTDMLIADANADRLLIDGFLYQGALAAASAASGTSSGIVLVGCDRPIIRNSCLMGSFGVAAIECRTTAVVSLQAYRLRIINFDNRAVATAGVGIEDVVTGSTGVIGPDIEIDVATDGANVTEAVTGATFRVIDPVYVSNADNQKALLINWAAVADA